LTERFISAFQWSNERIAALGKPKEVARAVRGQPAQRLFLHVGDQLVGLQVLGEGAGESGAGVESLPFPAQLRRPRHRFLQGGGLGAEALTDRAEVGRLLLPSAAAGFQQVDFVPVGGEGVESPALEPGPGRERLPDTGEPAAGGLPAELQLRPPCGCRLGLPPRPRCFRLERQSLLVEPLPLAL
jgi:hypothetical protein